MTSRSGQFRQRRLRSKERGAFLVLFVVIAGGILAVMALFVDFANVFITRDQASTAAEVAAHRALQEMYNPDYGPAFVPPAGPNWSGNAREAAARNAAILLALMHPAGPRMNFTTYYANPALNDANNATGDIVLGRWAKVVGGPYTFTPVAGVIAANGDLPNAARVTVRRTPAAPVAGVREGGNAIPYVLGIPGKTNPAGLSVMAPYTVVLTPAAMVGPGASTPVSGAANCRTGAMPIALVLRPAIATWITNNVIGSQVIVQIDRTPVALGAPPAGVQGTAYYTDFGLPGNPLANSLPMMRFLENTAGAQAAPPRVRLDDLPTRENLPVASANTLHAFLAANFLNRTWVLPVVADNNAATPAGTQLRVIGFVRVYCDQVVAGPPRRFRLQLAPSGNTRNVAGLVSCKRSFGGPVPANLLPPVLPATVNTWTLWRNTFWVTTDGFQVSSRLFGVCSSTATVRSHN